MKNYRIICELGEGGFGKIQLAERDGSGALCVVKRLKAGVASEGSASGRFLREAQLGSMLEHPNIARLIDARFEEGELIVCSELVVGRDLESIVDRLRAQKRTIPFELSITAMLCVLEALHHAHELRGTDGRHLGLVHRDVAPKNIMIGYAGEVKLIDFGIARADVGAFRTAPGMLVGTLSYLSPEQAMGGIVDRRTDVYCAGAVLFELLAGRPVFSDTALDGLLMQISRALPPSLSAIDPAIPKPLEAVIARALEKEPRRRYGTALELAEAIRRAAPDLVAGDREKLGGLVSSLFSKEKAEMDQRLAALEQRAITLVKTRTESPEMFLPTRSVRARARSKLPLLLAALAVAMIGLLMAAFGSKATEPLAASPRATAPTPSALPTAVAREEPEVEPEAKAVQKRPAKVRTAAVKPPQLEPPAVVKEDARIRRLRERLRALEQRQAGADLFALRDEIKAAAQAIDDARLRGEIQRRAHTAGTMGNLRESALAIDDLERALRAQ